MALSRVIGILARMREKTQAISAAVRAEEARRRQEAQASAEAILPLPARIVIRGTGTAFRQSMGASRRAKV